MKNTYLNQRITFARLPQQRGASLLEGIAYLGIAAIVVLGAVSLLTGAFSSAQSNRLTEEVLALRTGVKKLYIGQANGYTAQVINDNLIAASIVPQTLARDTANNKITNNWGSPVIVTGAGDTFTIQYDGVPKAECISAISGSSGWESIKSSGATKITTFPVSPDAAVAACSGATNSITWESR